MNYNDKIFLSLCLVIFTFLCILFSLSWKTFFRINPHVMRFYLQTQYYPFPSNPHILYVELEIFELNLMATDPVTRRPSPVPILLRQLRLPLSLTSAQVVSCSSFFKNVRGFAGGKCRFQPRVHGFNFTSFSTGFMFKTRARAHGKGV